LRTQPGCGLEKVQTQAGDDCIRMEGGRNDIDAFIKNLNTSTDFNHRILENNGEFKALWLTFSSNINFIKCCSQMVMLYATYKTTLYGFSLINVRLILLGEYLVQYIILYYTKYSIILIIVFVARVSLNFNDNTPSTIIIDTTIINH
jgi:hypothetical protein